MNNPNFQILDSTKKKKFVEKIEYLGVKKLPNVLLCRTGKERIVAFSGAISLPELSEVVRLLSVEGVGLYFGKENEEGGVRLSTDALHLLKNSISENIIEINEEQEKNWFLGKNIELTGEQHGKYKLFKDFVAVKFDEDFVGVGKISGDKKSIANFLPKERRIRLS